MPDETEQVQDWALLAQFAHSYRSLLFELLDEMALRSPQAKVLYTLFSQEGLSQSQIARKLSVRGATITNTLQQMEGAGLVSRRRDPEDNRLVRVYLTDAGRDKEDDIMKKLTKLESKIFVDLDEDERLQLRQVIPKMLFAMNAER